MIRNHDMDVYKAMELIRQNKTGYVPEEALQMARTIIEMDEDMEYMLHEHDRIMSVVAVFRNWRHGDYTDKQFLEMLRTSDNVNKALGLNDWDWKFKHDTKVDARWRALREGRRPDDAFEKIGVVPVGDKK